ncbi:MAG: hypothetical protein JXJ04_21260, partial [Spirochaetales bacterium]|nr:hypothetical protein [Spirochaetales bacterium]
PVREAAAFVSKRIKPGDVFFHADVHTMGTFVYHFPDNRHYLFLPEVPEGFNDTKTFGNNMLYSEMNNEVFSGVDTIWLLNRRGTHSTLSRASFSDKSFRMVEDRKTFEFDSSWYIITIDHYIRESSNRAEAGSL